MQLISFHNSLIPTRLVEMKRCTIMGRICHKCRRMEEKMALYDISRALGAFEENGVLGVRCSRSSGV
jgi:hypothetical protein